MAITIHPLGVSLGGSQNTSRWQSEYGQYHKAGTMLKQGLAIKKSKQDENDLRVALTLHEIGVCLRRLKDQRYIEAENALRQALTIENTKLGKYDLLWRSQCMILACVYGALGSMKRRRMYSGRP